MRGTAQPKTFSDSVQRQSYHKHLSSTISIPSFDVLSVTLLLQMTTRLPHHYFHPCTAPLPVQSHLNGGVSIDNVHCQRIRNSLRSMQSFQAGSLCYTAVRSVLLHDWSSALVSLVLITSRACTVWSALALASSA